MKKCCSSSTSKSLGQLAMAIESKSTDRAMSSVLQQNDKQSSQRFSLRGYVADMKMKDPKACNPFDNFENGEFKWKQLLGPVDVPPERRCRCSSCSGQVVRSNNSVEHRAANGDTNKALVEIIILDDSEDEEVTEITPQQEELTRFEEKASAGKGVTTYSREQIEKIPCLDKGKKVVIDIQDDEEEFVRQPQKTRKATGESSRPGGNTEVEDDDQTRIARTADFVRNQQQGKRKFSSSTLDLSLSLSCTRTEGDWNAGNEGISVESHRKRKGPVDALADNNVSELKSRRLMEMGKFLGKAFTSCEIIDLESPSLSTDARTRAVTIANANHGQKLVTPFEAGNTKTPLSFSAYANSTSRKSAKATSESSRPHGDEQKGPVDNSNTGAILSIEDISKSVCLTNWNPADFSLADPHNIYMRN